MAILQIFGMQLDTFCNQNPTGSKLENYGNIYKFIFKCRIGNPDTVLFLRPDNILRLDISRKAHAPFFSLAFEAPSTKERSAQLRLNSEKPLRFASHFLGNLCTEKSFIRQVDFKYISGSMNSK